MSTQEGGSGGPISPQRVEAAGTKIAGGLSGLGIDAVACWDDTVDAVLAHVVGRVLGCPVYYVFNSEGRIILESDIPQEASVAIVADSFDRYLSSVAQIVGVIRNNGGTVKAVGTRRLLTPTGHADLSGVVLVSGTAESV